MFQPGGMGGIQGDAGKIEAAAGAVVAVINRWSIRASGSYPDGRPRLRFKAQFSWKQDSLMAMIQRGEMKGRVRVQFRTKLGLEDVDVVSWSEWRLEDNVLTLEDVLHFDTKPIR